MRRTLLSTTSPIGLRANGRIMRATNFNDLGGGGAPTPTPQPNNSGGNGGGNQPTGGQGGNNTGEDVDISTFWNDPSPAPAPAPTSTPAPTPTPGQAPGTGQDQIGAMIQARLDGYTVPAILTDQVLKDMDGGNYESFQQNLSVAIKDSVGQAIRAQVQVLGAVIPQLMTRMQNLIAETSATKENYDHLYSEMPSAKDPVMGPIIKPLYDRALQLAKGDRTKAIPITKRLLTHLMEGTRTDLNLPSPTENAGEDWRSDTNFMESLVGLQPGR